MKPRFKVRLKFKEHMNYANVMATLAFFLAVSGGAAYAASHYLITSTRQIKPSVLASLKGKPGPAGERGPAGANGTSGGSGPAGNTGAAGPQGLTGPEGKEGKEGEKGAKGTQGIEGSPWTAGGVLPPEKTETGTWVYGAPKEAPAFAQVSFPIPLKEPLAAADVHWIGHGGPTSECPGTVAKPEAAPGNLCVYDQVATGTTSLEPPFIENPSDELSPFENTGAATAGALLFFGDVESEAGNAYGTWAVTAPKVS